MNEQIENIELSRLIPSKGNRNTGGFNPLKLDQLAESIRSIGVQQPAVVRKKGDKFEIICGERRWRASKIAGMKYLPCRVRELTDAEALHIQIIENIQREDIHPFDEADGYERLRRDGGFEIEQIATEVGRTPAHIYQRLKLLGLAEKARDLFLNEKINTAVAIQIARLSPEQQDQVVDEFLDAWKIKNGVTAKDVEEYIQRNIMHELSKASWSKTDATLVPDAGACNICPKRTGANPTLFEEMNPKKDKCLDGNCFEFKIRALVEKRKKELEGTKHFLVKDSWTSESIPGTLESYKWKECKKNDEGAVRVLVVAGQKPGRLTYGKVTAGCVPTDTDESKAERARERKLDKAREELLITLYNNLHREMERAVSSDDRLVWMRFVVKTLFYNLNHEAQILVSKRENWEKPKNNEYISVVAARKIEEMNINCLMVFLSTMVLAPLSRPCTFSQKIIADNYQVAADILDIDLDSQISEFATESGFSREELAKESEGDETDGSDDNDSDDDSGDDE